MLSYFLDIDECATELDGCSDDAACTDTDGSYECTCNSGFTGDGFTCTSKSIPIPFFCVLELSSFFRHTHDTHIDTLSAYVFYKFLRH